MRVNQLLQRTGSSISQANWAKEVYRGETTFSEGDGFQKPERGTEDVERDWFATEQALREGKKGEYPEKK